MMQFLPVAAAPDPVATPDRPRTRADCLTAPRPCPWVSCRHHLLLDVTPAGTIRFGGGRLGADGTPLLGQMADTCVLDVADRGGATLAETGAALGVTRERARQIEATAKRKVGRQGVQLGEPGPAARARPLESTEPRVRKPRMRREGVRRCARCGRSGHYATTCPERANP